MVHGRIVVDNLLLFSVTNLSLSQSDRILVTIATVHLYYIAADEKCLTAPVES